MSRLAARNGETTAGARQELVAALDFPPPREVAPGRGSALFACGWCASPRAEVKHVELVLDGEVTAASAERMPQGEPGDELTLVARARLADWSGADC
jgi:hypothetical protein